MNIQILDTFDGMSDKGGSLYGHNVTKDRENHEMFMAIVILATCLIVQHAKPKPVNLNRSGRYNCLSNRRGEKRNHTVVGAVSETQGKFKTSCCRN